MQAVGFADDCGVKPPVIPGGTFVQSLFGFATPSTTTTNGHEQAGGSSPSKLDENEDGDDNGCCGGGGGEQTTCCGGGGGGKKKQNGRLRPKHQLGDVRWKCIQIISSEYVKHGGALVKQSIHLRPVYSVAWLSCP